MGVGVLAREGRSVEDDDCLSSSRNLSEASISLGGCFLLWDTRDKSMLEGPDLSRFGRWERELYDKKAWAGG